MNIDDNQVLLILAASEMYHSFSGFFRDSKHSITNLERIALEGKPEMARLVKLTAEVARRQSTHYERFSDAIHAIYHPSSATKTSDIKLLIEEYCDFMNFIEGITEEDGTERYFRGEKIVPISAYALHYQLLLTQGLSAKIDENIFYLIIKDIISNSDQHEAKNVTITTYLADGFAVTEITDDGKGIPKDMLDHVKEPFVSGRGSTGIGLAFADLAIRQAGGKLDIKSVEGKYTMVKIYVPAENS